MASTRNLQATIRWALPFINFQPVEITGNEPVLECANMIMQTILGPPFCWAWNRGVVTINCLVSIQDYLQNVADFGFIEGGSVAYPDGSDVKELEVSRVLSSSVDQERPANVASQADDNAGNITFRFMGPPDKNYTAVLFYQRKAPPMTSLASLWSPIPDHLSYISNWGLLAMLAILNKDNRFPIFNDKFLSHLLGAQEGLDEMARNLFLSNWLQVTRAVEQSQLKVQQGIVSRTK